MPVGLDLEWEVDASFGDIRAHDGELDGYEQFGVVHGEVLLGRTRIEIDTYARRSHRWGVPQWDRPFSSYWMRGQDAAESGRTYDLRTARELGRFVVPVGDGGRARGVVERRLRRLEAGNGWSTTYVPE